MVVTVVTSKKTLKSTGSAVFIVTHKLIVYLLIQAVYRVLQEYGICNNPMLSRIVGFVDKTL